MRRGIAVTWHLVSFLIAAVLYFVFVLPRWWELTGDWSHGLGTAARIITGLLLALTALPVLLTLNKARKPEFGTPELALTLRVWSIIGHVTAGVLILATAIAEIWLDLDDHGRSLFAVYGAAAAIALLGATAFYLAMAAELPPPPPKPLKPKKASGRRRGGDAGGDDSDADAVEETVEAEAETVTEEAEDTAAAAESDDSDTDTDTEAPDAEAPDADAVTEEAVTEEAETPAPKSRLRNRRAKKSSGATVSDD